MLQEKSVTRKEDLVLIHEVNTIGPLKGKLKEYVIKEYEEIKMLKWEALELVRKANEYSLKVEFIYRKKFNELPDNIQYQAKEKFFIDYLKDMPDEKADKLAEVLDLMVNKHLKN